MGPSGPTGSPLPTAQAQEKNLTTNVLMLKICLTRAPFRYPINSGRPDPAADGLKNWKKMKTTSVVPPKLDLATYSELYGII